MVATTEVKQALTSAEQAKKFIFAGKSRFTLRSIKTGTRYTFKVSQGKDRMTGRKKEGLFFASLLTGPDNTSSYQYIGYFTAGELRASAKSRGGPSSAPFKALDFTVKMLTGEKGKPGHIPTTLEIWHEGRCGRCGKVLTVPESIQSGFGPECISKI